MLKEGGVTVLECFMLSIVPVDWVIACMVPLYKGKGDMYECSNFRGISLLSVVGKVYCRVLINRIRDKTENVIAEVQGGFRRGRGCTDQIFIVRQICEKYLGKGKDVYFAFLDLEKAYDRVDRDAIWNVLRLYGIVGRLLRGVKSLYVGSKACVRVRNEVSDLDLCDFWHVAKRRSHQAIQRIYISVHQQKLEIRLYKTLKKHINRK